MKCPDSLMEKLASIEHDRWSGQAKTAIDEMTPERRERWGRLSRIAYADLDEHNKELDRMQVREYFKVIAEYLDAIEKRKPFMRDDHCCTCRCSKCVEYDAEAERHSW